MSMEVFNSNNNRKRAKEEFMTRFKQWINSGKVSVGITYRTEELTEPGGYVIGKFTDCKNKGVPYEEQEEITIGLLDDECRYLEIKLPLSRYLREIREDFSLGRIENVKYTPLDPGKQP